MPMWMIGGWIAPWWLGLTVIPVKRSASLLSMYHASDDCTIEIGP